MIRQGQIAPRFELPGVSGGTIDMHSLTEYTDRGWAAVVVFYPFDFHTSCTEQLCTIRDADPLTLVEGTVVLGVSTDGVYSHAEYGDRHALEFPLLSDHDGSVARAYGVLREEFEAHRAVSASALFVVDPDRTVQYAWCSEGSTDSPDIEAVAKATTCHDGTCDLPDDKSYLG